MPSRVIRPTAAPADAPFAYTVGAAGGFAAEAVFASWDGTGAGGDFLPCVSYYNPEGVLLDRAFPTTGAVAAGDTAEVSYRPFDRGGGGAATAQPTMELVSNGGSATACPANTVVEIPLAHQTGALLLNLANPFQPHLIAAGTYAFSFNITPAAGFPASAVPWWTIMSTFDTVTQQAQAQSTFATSPVSHVAASVALTRNCAALCSFRLLVTHNEASPRSFFASGIVEKLA